MSTELSTPQAAPKKAALTIRQNLESPAFADQIAKALPKHLTPDRFIRVAVTAMTKTPLLAQCDQASFFGALLTLSQFGLEPDGRRAHLIPFKNNKRNCYEVQLIIDYKGLAELALRSGVVSYLHADVVCENDVFEYNMGEIAKHNVNFREPRGKAYAAYAICKFKDGTAKAEVMPVADIEAIRKRSRAGQSGPWVTDWNEMAKKTVFRRLSKWLPLSPEIRDVLEKDDDIIDVEEVRRGPKALETPLNPFELPEPTPETDEAEVTSSEAAKQLPTEKPTIQSELLSEGEKAKV
ncbi:hypothetical protein Ga0100231_005045 [Opitutaceae bacterium TAV4]|nr:hypothetical protein Ga0100231_005045 [Opitutaceae bacterium TAV4]RRK02361.1 hypothetical protein Ga0100230_004185 [Opitutaceae bacterium TAV3]